MIHYNEMAADIRSFDYNKETNMGVVRGTRSSASVSSGQRSIKGLSMPRDLFHHEDYQVLNQQKVPQNIMEKIEKANLKVRRALAKHFGNADELNTALAE